MVVLRPHYTNHSTIDVIVDWPSKQQARVWDILFRVRLSG